MPERPQSLIDSERLTGALLDRLTHHVHILEMNGASYWLKQCNNSRQRCVSHAPPNKPAAIRVDREVRALEVA